MSFKKYLLIYILINVPLMGCMFYLSLDFKPIIPMQQKTLDEIKIDIQLLLNLCFETNEKEFLNMFYSNNTSMENTSLPCKLKVWLNSLFHVIQIKSSYPYIYGIVISTDLITNHLDAIDNCKHLEILHIKEYIFNKIIHNKLDNHIVIYLMNILDNVEYNNFNYLKVILINQNS